jgi:Ca2+-binding RTX toxin-like protein
MVAKALGQEIIVNGITPGLQYRPVITNLASGGFVIAWQDASGLGSADVSDDVRFARFDAFGVRLTGAADTLANTSTPSAQFDPSIAAGPNGKFVVAWSDSSGTAPDFNNRAVRFQIFNEDGTKSGVEKIANTTFPLSQDEPSITVLANGNIVVTWTSEIVSASSTTDIIRRVFDSSGNPLTGEQAVNTQLVGDQDHSAVHALSNGGFAVVWQDREDSVTTGFQTKTFVRFYNSAGTASSLPIVANEAAASDPLSVGFTELSTGRIVFTWTEPNTAAPGDASGSSIRYRVYDPGLGIFSAAFRANTTTLNDQDDAQVAALDNGQFVIVWTDHDATLSADNSFTSVKMQIFNSAGAKVGGEVLVNSQFTFEQENPTVTVLDDFRFVVTWQDNSQTGTDMAGFSIHSRIFDARAAGINISGDASANDYVGSDFGDTINGLAGSDKILGGKGIDFIFGGIGIDFLYGEDGDDELNGGADNDTLSGGAGKDKMTGGAGNDTYYVDNALDQVFEAAGGGTADRVLASVSYILTAGQEIEILTTANSAGAGAINLTGNAFNQLIHGNGGVNVLNGGGGIDTMSGFGGNDQYYVDVADDLVIEAAGGGSDRVFASVSYVLSAGQQIEVLTTTNTAGLGAINLTGNAFNQLMHGNAGNNVLNGGGGIDTMSGFGGNDQYYVDVAGDIVNEATGGGSDRVFAGVSYVLGAGQQIEILTTTNTAGLGAINLTGNAFSQTMHGNGGANVLNGGAGNDVISGFGGSDIFVFNTALNAATNHDTITDFNVAADTIHLENAVFTALAATGALAAGLFRDISLGAQDANDVIIYNRVTGDLFYDSNGLAAGGQTLFADVTNGLALTAADFVVI